MKGIPDDYSLQTVRAMDLEPDDIVHGEGGGVVADRPTEDPDPNCRLPPYAHVRFVDGSDARYLIDQNIDVYRRRTSWSEIADDPHCNEPSVNGDGDGDSAPQRTET